MTEAWFIDALDARGGLCFASRRAEHPDSLTELVRPQEMVFFTAPDFGPVSIPNQAVVFGAARGSFQEGLLLKGREVAFRELDELIEFVRRVYLSSGGGDEGPRPPLPPEDQDRGPAGEPEYPSGEGQDLGELIAMQVREAYSQLPPYAETVASHPLLWKLPSKPLQTSNDSSKPPPFSSAPLRRAVFLLIQEMLLRMPGPRQGGETLSWLRAARALGRGIAAVGLPIDDVIRQISSRHDRRVVSFYEAAFHRPPHSRSQIYAALFHPWLGSAHYDYDLPPWEWYSPPSAREDDSDPTLLLQQIPVPLDLARPLDKGIFEAGSPSLFSLLLVALAAPRCLAKEPHLSDLLLLSACFIQVPNYGPAPWGTYERTLQEHHLNELQLAAASWLKEALPASVFPEELEVEIERAPSLRYGSAQART